MRLTYFFPAYILYASLLILQVLSQETQTIILNDETDAFINQILSDWNSPGGVSVAIVKKSAQGTWLTETKGYGLATANGTKVNEDTLFAIASNSKLFTILATGLLINNETFSPRLSWTSKLASVIPNWGLMDPVASKQATIIDAMSHRTGIPRHDLMYHWSDKVEDIVQRMKYLPPSIEFRDRWQYTNTMYMLLSSLPPLLLPSKTTFSQYVKQHFFDPLRMDSTTYSFDKAKASGKMADGLTRQGVNISVDPFGNGTVRTLPFWKEGGGEDGNPLAGAGGIISNAVDMAKWLQALLLAGANSKTEDVVIPASVLDKVATGITVVAGKAQFPEQSVTEYGGGQIRGTYRGHEIIEHGGNVPGFNSQVTHLPFDNLGVAVLSNDHKYGSFIMEIIKFYILDSMLGMEKVDWNKRYKSGASAQASTRPIPTPRPNNATLPSVKLADLAGTYSNRGYGSFEFCLVSSTSGAATHASPSCRTLASNISEILPGAVDPTLPTLLAKWDNPWASHVKLTHFNGNIFNISLLTSLPTNDPAEPYWVYDDNTPGSYAESAAGGFGFIGVWGAASGTASPAEKTVKERAEVWFDKRT